MNLLNKLFLQKVIPSFTVLLLSACGGSDVFNNESSRDALPATAELQSIADNATAQSIKVDTPKGLLSTYSPAAAAATADAIIYSGTIDLPYYLDPEKSTTSFWEPALTIKDTVKAPVIMSVPLGTPPTSAGWPIVIYQHGITRNRTDILAYTGGLAQAGHAVIAIDLPAHGVPLEELAFPPDVPSPMYVPNPLAPFFHADYTVEAPDETADTEQTFGVDLQTHTATLDADGDEISTDVPDGKVDKPGTHFITLTSLLTARDNLRQGAANLITLRKSLVNLPNIDESKVGLIAHSLGGMVAIPYLAVEATPTPSSIVMSGATIRTVLEESESFSGTIRKGLAKKGITDLDAFYTNAQIVVDAGEPANYATAAAKRHPIHMIEVLGDKTVPNSSTEHLADLMGAKAITSLAPTAIVAGAPGLVRFNKGYHGSPLDPSKHPLSNVQATSEIQKQLATFQATAIAYPAPLVIINDCSVIDGVTCVQPQ